MRDTEHQEGRRQQDRRQEPQAHQARTERQEPQAHQARTERQEPQARPERIPYGFWTQDRLDWLRDEFQQHPLSQLTDLWNQHWSDQTGRVLGKGQIKAALVNHHIISHRRGGGIKGILVSWTQEQIDWLRAHRQSQSLQTLTEQFNQHFGTQRTPHVVGCQCRNRGITSTRPRRTPPGRYLWNKARRGHAEASRAGQFKPGGIAHNHYPIGTLIRNTAGYWAVKIADMPGNTIQRSADNWIMYHRFFWEKHHGPVPPQHIVAFLDGNPHNLDLDNLICIHRKLQLMWTQALTPEATLEQRLVALERAKLKAAAYQRARAQGIDYRKIQRLFAGDQPPRRRSAGNSPETP